MQQAITKGDMLQKMAGVSFVVGAIVTIIFNLLFPRAEASGFENVQPFLQALSDKGSTLMTVYSLLLAVGIWALMIGWVGIYRSISSGSGAVWARLGFYGVIVGTTMWTVFFTMQMGVSLAAERWADSPAAAKIPWEITASSLSLTSFFLFTMSVVVYWLALLFVAIGMILSKAYPSWIGYILALLGLLTVAIVGVPQLFTGPTQALTNILFPILSIIILAWTLIVGIWVTRKAW